MADPRPGDKPRVIEGGGGPKWHELSRGGGPVASYRNAMVALTTMGVAFSFDEFRQRAFVHWHMFGDDVIEMSDRHALRLRKAIADRYGFDPKKDNLNDAVATLCEERSFNPVLTYIDGLKWDGKRRIDTWLHTYLGAEDTPLNGEFGRKFLIAGIRRVRQPGCKFDYILILEGAQGAGKSTAVADLSFSPTLFTDQDMIHVETKVQQELLAGKWIVEFAELNGFSKSDIDRTKAFASRQYDRGRPAWGHYSVDQPRRCIMFGTTNGDHYLSDPTGNRRFWPVRVGYVPWGAVKTDRDQLWAEAAAAEAAGESLEIDSELRPEAVYQQRKRMVIDPWDDVLRVALIGSEDRITTNTLLGGDAYLKLPRDKQTSAAASRLAAAMSRLGWEGPKNMKVGTSVLRGYVRSLKEPLDEED